MTALELERRADRQHVPRAVLCLAVDVLWPVLAEALAAAGPWKWIRRMGIQAVLALLDEYQERNRTWRSD